MRVAVVGAGVIGALIAYRLACHDVEVILIDRAEPGAGTSGKTFSWLNSNEKRPREYYELNLAGLRAHLRLREEFERTPWLHSGGNLEWAGDAETRQCLADRVERLRSWGYDVQWMTAEQVNARLEPELSLPNGNSHIAYFPEEGWIDAVAFARHFADLAAGRGARCEFGVAVTEISRSERLTAVRIGDADPVRVDAVVNAAGASADEVAALAGTSLPLAPTSGLLVRLSAEGTTLGRVVHAPGVNLRPDGPDNILLHHDSVDERMWHGEPEQALAAELVERTHRVLPTLRGRAVIDTRVGVRPMPADGLPSIGRLSSLPGYYEAVTHSGATLAPAIADALTEEILTGEVTPLAAPFSADRLPRP
ncbi:MAG: FAD-dependent oxidoreductase [Pseudonocardiaceae bacterium]|nr:FAD-dependent oxidoreductase [Pseudonocardiaceae bacterium]